VTAVYCTHYEDLSTQKIRTMKINFLLYFWMILRDSNLVQHVMRQSRGKRFTTDRQTCTHTDMQIDNSQVLYSTEGLHDYLQQLDLCFYPLPLAGRSAAQLDHIPCHLDTLVRVVCAPPVDVRGKR
jgi:hypothetical protein